MCAAWAAETVEAGGGGHGLARDVAGTHWDNEHLRAGSVPSRRRCAGSRGGGRTLGRRGWGWGWGGSQLPPHPSFELSRQALPMEASSEHGAEWGPAEPGCGNLSVLASRAAERTAASWGPWGGVGEGLHAS